MKELEQFKQFLVENDVLDKYIKYAYITRTESRYKVSKYISQIIDWAFLWSDTDEGHRFWMELNIKWLDKCDTENISYICTVESVVDYLQYDTELWED